jgi:hypothetical protein
MMVSRSASNSISARDSISASIARNGNDSGIEGEEAGHEGVAGFARGL